MTDLQRRDANGGPTTAPLRVSKAVEAFDEWAAQGRAREDRAEYIRLMRAEGRTFEEISGTLGITRERVRQIAERFGIPNPTLLSADPAKLLSALRLADVTTLPQLSARLGMSTGPVVEALKALDIHEAALRLLRWRRMYPTRQKWANVIRAEAARLGGRMPTQLELSAAFGVRPTAAAPMMSQVFGSLRKAAIYCGLTPRVQGGKGHLVPRQKEPMCRRGHPREGNRFPSGQCRLCSRLRDRRRAKHPKASPTASRQ